MSERGVPAAPPPASGLVRIFGDDTPSGDDGQSF